MQNLSMSLYTIVMSVITIVCSLYVIFSVLRRTIAKDVDQKFEKVEKEIQDLQQALLHNK
jgi:Skp family chaperone for outer membrane proteins